MIAAILINVFPFHRMRKRTVLLIVGFLLIGLALGGLALRKTVTLVVNGEGRKITTFAFTVGELLRGQGLAASPSDRLQPSASHWLQSGDRIELDNAAQVQIRADGKTTTLLSPERTPKTLLTQAGIVLYPGDQLFSNGASITPEQPLPYAPSHSLDVRRAVSFTLATDSGTEKYTSSAATLGEALWQAGITLYATDRLQPPPETLLTAGLQAQLTRSQGVTVHAQTGEVHLRSAASTVGEILAQAGLSLQGLDYSQPSAEAPLPADGQIRLVRVREEVILEQSALPFTTTWQAVDTLELDNQMLVQAGVPGINARRVRVRFEDDVEISRQVETEWIASLSQTEIMGYGMLMVPHTLETPDGTITYYRALSFWATSYHPAEGGNHTATGKLLQKGIVAIDPTYIAYGTRLYIPGYGFGDAQDTGHLIGRWIDLGYSDEDYVPWHQWVTVYFLWPPPDYVPWMIPPPETY